MQKAFVIRTALEHASGASFSHEVDVAPDAERASLSKYLADGWRVVHSCPMPSDLESCCLLVLESPAEAASSAMPTNNPVVPDAMPRFQIIG